MQVTSEVTRTDVTNAKYAGILDMPGVGHSEGKHAPTGVQGRTTYRGQNA